MPLLQKRVSYFAGKPFEPSFRDPRLLRHLQVQSGRYLKQMNGDLRLFGCFSLFVCFCQRFAFGSLESLVRRLLGAAGGRVFHFNDFAG